MTSLRKDIKKIAQTIADTAVKGTQELLKINAHGEVAKFEFIDPKTLVIEWVDGENVIKIHANGQHMPLRVSKNQKTGSYFAHWTAVRTALKALDVEIHVAQCQAEKEEKAKQEEADKAQEEKARQERLDEVLKRALRRMGMRATVDPFGFKGLTKSELKRKFKKLCLEHHPDRGGKQETMQHLNKEFQKYLAVL